MDEMPKLPAPSDEDDEACARRDLALLDDAVVGGVGKPDCC